MNNLDDEFDDFEEENAKEYLRNDSHGRSRKRYYDFKNVL